MLRRKRKRCCASRTVRLRVWNQYFSAVRIDEFKYIFTAEIENGLFQKGDIGGFSGPIVTDTGGVIMINLYTDPQEDVNVGIRHIPMITSVGAAMEFYMKDLIKRSEEHTSELQSLRHLV